MQSGKGEHTLTWHICRVGLVDFAFLRCSIRAILIFAMNEFRINQLHQQFVKFGDNTKKWQRRCALLLPKIRKYEVWKKKGFNSIHEYAGKLAGMSHGQVNDALWIIEKIQDKPELMEVARTKGLNSVRPTATIATKETAQYWAKKASEMSKGELAVFVKGVRMNQTENLSDYGEKISMKSQKTITLNLRAEIAAKLEKLFKGDWNELIEALIEAYNENLNNKKPKLVVSNFRHIPQKIQKFVIKRSRGRCEFPDCYKLYKTLHHVNRFASNKVHDPDQIIALCKAHHGLAHHGLIKNELDVPADWKLRNEPDYTDLNWYVDHKVQFYRRV